MSINKYISKLSFNPGSIDQVSFYLRRLHQEQSIRRLGIFFIILSFLVQIAATSIPAKQSLAASGNDVISGGVSSISDLKSNYYRKQDVKELYNRFGLNAAGMDNAQNTSFNFQEQGSKGTRTVGRINFASTNDHNLGKFGGSTFYSRNAAEWKGSTPAYYFGKHQGTDGRYWYVWVLKDCGNIAYRPADAPPAPAPKPEPKPKPGPAPTKPKPTPTPTTPAPTTPAPTTPTPVTPQPNPVCIYNSALAADDPRCKEQVCVNNPLLKPEDPLCICKDDPKLTADDPKCTTPKRQKKARNITQNLDPEQTLVAKARANDVIEYTLITTNTNTQNKTKYLVEDFVGDVLDYADIDTAFLDAQGGKFNPTTKVVYWDNQTIPAKGDIQKQFRVKMKATIPVTHAPSASSPSYDCRIQNGYGNEIALSVDCPVLKQVEQLPNTGPGQSIFFAFAITTLSGYFFARSRLFTKELGIVKQDYTFGGK